VLRKLHCGRPQNLGTPKKFDLSHDRFSDSPSHSFSTGRGWKGERQIFHGVQFGIGVLILYVPSCDLSTAAAICQIMASRFHHCLGLVLVVGVEEAGVCWFLMFCCIIIMVFMIKQYRQPAL
jgi:hypothetical protein